ncbi:hypothetical protein [Fructobacillus parabroussonetiae]|uniref:Integral membrane protein n=1 Tax=Fructobacillus parabroussonetiae TaxID=2713174 RepID=A0ABS5QZW3_9LACO|nr:hypothetical protein [Fructobacillus parabroussonetiae]MBS9337452.1 hypothetical protein [Fructobacillus parabroussonetiae]
MLQAVMNGLKKSLTKWLLTMAIVTLLLPYLASVYNLSTLSKVLVLYFFLNGGFALAFGYAIRKKGFHFYYVFLQPLVFALLSNWFFSLVNETYGYYLAFLYLVLTFFTYLANTTNDPDENELPVDGGYQDV